MVAAVVVVVAVVVVAVVAAAVAEAVLEQVGRWWALSLFVAGSSCWCVQWMFAGTLLMIMVALAWHALGAMCQVCWTLS